jgi:hypothetical protein
MQVSTASLLAPVLPLFRNLKIIRGYWKGDGLARTHLNALQNCPLLETLSVMYYGHVDLGPHFPEGDILIWLVQPVDGMLE